MNRRFAFDIDGTVACFVNVFLEMYCERFNCLRKESDVTSWDLDKIFFGGDLESFRSFVNDVICSDKLIHYPLYDGAGEFLNQYHKKHVTDKVYFITNREKNFNVMRSTRKWEEAHFSGFGTKVIFADGRNKVDILLELGINVFFDDCIQDFIEPEKGIDRLTDTGIVLFSPVRYWNLKYAFSHKNLIVFNSWRALIASLF